jgi:hypothetical protein
VVEKMTPLEVFTDTTRLGIGFMSCDLGKLFTETGSYVAWFRENFVPEHDGLVQRLVVVVVVVVAGGTSRFNYCHLASLRLTTTEAETHNERLCAHTLGDHTRHAYPCVCANVCMCGMCIFK